MIRAITASPWLIAAPTMCVLMIPDESVNPDAHRGCPPGSRRPR